MKLTDAQRDALRIAYRAKHDNKYGTAIYGSNRNTILPGSYGRSYWIYQQTAEALVKAGLLQTRCDPGLFELTQAGEDEVQRLGLRSKVNSMDGIEYTQNSSLPMEFGIKLDPIIKLEHGDSVHSDWGGKGGSTVYIHGCAECGKLMYRRLIALVPIFCDGCVDKVRAREKMYPTDYEIKTNDPAKLDTNAQSTKIEFTCLGSDWSVGNELEDELDEDE